MKAAVNKKNQIKETLIVIFTLIILWFCFSLGKDYREQAKDNYKIENIQQ